MRLFIRASFYFLLIFAFSCKKVKLKRMRIVGVTDQPTLPLKICKPDMLVTAFLLLIKPIQMVSPHMDQLVIQIVPGL
ncbi:hypothetical protein LXL81_04750 [Dyadobacter sp. CY356]|nr:hypothetical protein [Dyadobacter sp. CY356]